MNVTQYLSELCNLLVDDIHGELPSRIFSAIASRSGSTIEQICAHTGLPRKKVRSGLAVLIQFNLVYHYTEDDRRKTTLYEANTNASYALIRAGTIIDVVAQEHGDTDAELVQTLAGLGSARLRDLEDAYVARHQTTTKTKATSNGKANGAGPMTNGWGSDDADATNGHSEPESVAEKLSSSIIELLKSDILEICTPRTFTSPFNSRKAIEKEVLRTHFYGTTPKGSRGQEQFMGYVREKMLEVRDQPRVLKEQLIRKLEAARQDNLGSKMRKSENGTSAKTTVTCADVDPSATVRINYEKILVLLRNQALVAWATQMLGHVPGQVYAVALRIIGKHVERCRPDRLLDLTLTDKYGNEQNKSLHDMEYPHFTTLDVVEALPHDLDVTSAIGKVSKGSVDPRRADRIRTHPPRSRLPFVDDDTDSSGEEADEENEDEDEDEKLDGDQDDFSFIPQREANSDVPLEEDDPRIEPTRQHLLVLADRSQRFVRHCGRAERGEWAVDFKPLVTKLQKFQVNTFIENRFSRQGLRLVNILREKGKLDDKTLAGIALMPKPEANAVLWEMFLYGIVQIQEVPRDNNRQAARMIYLWFFEDSKAKATILCKSYQGMARCHQFLEVERYRNRETLELFERSDVKGKEEEKLHPDTIAKYQQHLKRASGLVNQIIRVDEDIIGPLRDF